MENLFIAPELSFEKVAAEAALPEDATTWPNEILQELYKQAPYVSDFEPHIVMDRVDAEKGFGFGHIEIGNKTAMLPTAGSESEQTAGVHKIRIPIIVKLNKLQPLDILVTEDSKMLPLTETRIRQALFRPQTFDITSQTPGDHSMIGQLYPPFRQNYGFGGGGATMSAGGMGKEGSERLTPAKTKIAAWDNLKSRHKGAIIGAALGKPTGVGLPIGALAGYLIGKHSEKGENKEKEASLLATILPTANGAEIEKIALQIAEDPGLQAALLQNSFATGPSLALLSVAPTDLTEKTAEALPSMIKADVVQLLPTVNGLQVKTANHSFWQPITTIVDRGEAVRRFGSKIVLAADLNGGVTMVEGEGPPEPEQGTAETEAQLISTYGIYKVHDMEGKELIGYVFPNLIDLTGSLIPLALFTNGSQAAIQGEILGTPVGEGNNLPTGRPHGYGAFWRMTEDGAEATIPFELKGSFSQDGSVNMIGTSFDGTEIIVSCNQPNLEQITSDGQTVLIPDSFQWLPLNKSNEVALASKPEEIVEEEAKEASAVITVRANNGLFSFEGPSVEKLATANRTFLDLNEAIFLLSGLGVHQVDGLKKLATSMYENRPVAIATHRTLKLASTVKQEAIEMAKTALSKFPDWKVNLIKEAAVIPDPTAVDTVLSLGFLNEENLDHFITYLPTLDQAQEKLCELLISTRLGLKEIPAGAVERSIRSLEEVIEGLKILAFQQN